MDLRLWLRLAVVALAIAFFTPPRAPAQRSSDLTFAVVSIQPDRAAGEHSLFYFEDTATRVEAATVVDLVTNAFHFRSDAVKGLPAWAGIDRFRIIAKVSPEDSETLKKLPRIQRRDMLCAILEERFHLRTHVAKEQRPILELVKSKDVAGLRPAPTNGSDAASNEAFPTGAIRVTDDGSL